VPREPSALEQDAVEALVLLDFSTRDARLFLEDSRRRTGDLPSLIGHVRRLRVEELAKAWTESDRSRLCTRVLGPLSALLAQREGSSPPGR